MVAGPVDVMIQYFVDVNSTTLEPSNMEYACFPDRN